MKWRLFINPRLNLRFWALFGVCWMQLSCSSSIPVADVNDRSSAASPYGRTAASGSNYRPVPSSPLKSPATLYREVNVKKDYIPKGTHGRKVRRSMRPRYITIHSTQNYSAGAWQHSKALRNGKLRARKRRGGNRIGYLTWHFTVDEGVAVQHLPTNEQGEHADFDGPGNNYSVAIEMCENRGNSRSATLERTAKLAAYLMHQYGIPLRKVVPHYHWRRKGLSIEHKNCPHFLMDNGHPGAKWQWFLAKVNKHYKSISVGSPHLIAPMRISNTTSNSSSPVATTPPATSASKPTATVAKPAKRPSTRIHTVKKGDTLYALSRRYKTSVSAIQRANSMSGSTISIGKRLKIPVG